MKILELLEDQPVEQTENNDEAIRNLNRDQIIAYNAILNVLQQNIHNEQTNQSVFYIDDLGGTGKTFLYNVLQNVTKERFQRKYVVVA